MFCWKGRRGLGKPRSSRLFSTACGLREGRIQFTPDLMPADITGSMVVQQDPLTSRIYHEFRPGPVFVNLLLADEINRASPKTQSALLEVMAERRVTVNGDMHRPGRDYAAETWQAGDTGIFQVLATQNPIEQQGTYPLPEAQLDRFFFKLDMLYPDCEALSLIIGRTTGPDDQQPRAGHVAGLDFQTMQRLQRLPRLVEMPPSVVQHVVELVSLLSPEKTTRQRSVLRETEEYVDCGPSPRGAQTLVLAAKTLALADKRPAAGIEDVNAVACPALRHRLLLNFRAARRITADELIGKAIEHLEAKRPVPPGRSGERRRLRSMVGRE